MSKPARSIEFVDPELEALQKIIAEKLGYRLVDHRMELYGVAINRDD
jgi:Fur family transcriptional regulator, ferric uptake regulator